MGRVEKFLFVSSIFLLFGYYGLLNVVIGMGVPSYFMSVGVRGYILGSSLYLLAISYARHSFPEFTRPIYFFFTYVVLFLTVFTFDNFSSYYQSTAPTINIGFKQYYLYIIVFIYFSSFFLFFVDRIRFNYIVNTPIIFYAGFMFAVVLVLLVNRGALSTLSLEGTSAYNINRGQTGTAATLYAMALYYFFFSNTLAKKVFLGCGGILLSVLNLVISDSRTSVLAFIVITLFYVFYIIRFFKKHIFSVLALLGALFLVALLSFPFISQSNAYARFAKILFFMQEYTLTGSSEFDRIDLLHAGFSEFLKSPIWGGSVFIPGGLYSHFAPVDILMTTGILGGVITIVICVGMFRGFVFFLKEKQTSWICTLSIAFFINCLTSGCSFSIISYIPALLLIADAIRMETPLPLYNDPRINSMR